MKREWRGGWQSTGGGAEEAKKKRQTIGMKWTVVKASALLSIKQSGGDDLLSQGEQGLCSVCILHVLWWSCGLYPGVFLKQEIIITPRVAKKWSKITNWNFWHSLHFPSPPLHPSICFPSFLVVNSNNLLIHIIHWFTFCLSSPAAPVSLSFSAEKEEVASHSISSFHNSPSPLAPSLSSPQSLSPPWNKWQDSLLPFPERGEVGVEQQQQQQRGGLCSQIDLCHVHQMDEPGRSQPGLNSMHDTLICHALACTSSPAKTLSWLPSQLSPYSLST